MALYCHECVLPLAAETPVVLLPCRLYVVTHAQQRLSNATGVHLPLLAPGQARLVSLEELPPLGSGAVVLFPSANSVPVDSLDLATVTDVVVIDSKWGQAKGVLADAKLAGVRQVHLRDYRTCFWRYHTAGVPEEGLCTVEAVFFCFRELHSRAHAGEVCRCFDNLLWYFAQQHHLATKKISALH
jgi:DTW domain-containing protein YfiP